MANGKEEVLHFIQHGQVNISEIKTLLMITDGLFGIPNYSIEETFKKIQTIGLHGYSKGIINMRKQIIFVQMLVS